MFLTIFFNKILFFPAEVMQRGELRPDVEVMDSVVFQRGVFYMSGFNGSNGSVIDTEMNWNVNCTLMKFHNTELYDISSAVLQDQTIAHDNDTFLCMSLWPNGTREFVTKGTHVKCMPQNGKWRIWSYYKGLSIKDVRSQEEGGFHWRTRRGEVSSRRLEFLLNFSKIMICPCGQMEWS